jgi:3-hydroxyisobutyrate dehydrogenase
MAGGTEEALQSGHEILQAMSAPSKLYLVPGGIGAGSNMKMVHQVLAAIHILGASEAMGLAAQLGLDARTTADKIIRSETWTWMHENRFPRMVEEDWNPGASALTIILKDAVSYDSSEVVVFGLALMILVLTGYHHYICPSTPVPDASLYHIRTDLHLCFVTGLWP